jgi:hypothetical protein
MPSPDDCDCVRVGNVCERDRDAFVVLGDPGIGDIINRASFLPNIEPSSRSTKRPAGMGGTQRDSPFTDLYRQGTIGVVRRTTWIAMVLPLGLLGCATSAEGPGGGDEAGGSAGTSPGSGGNPAPEGSAPADVVQPSCDASQRCTLAWGAYLFVVDAGRGGRIVELSLEGVNVLVAAAAGAAQFGSTFWTSPQADWPWPPAAALDTGPYAVRIESGLLRLASASFIIQDHAMTVEKAFVVSRSKNVVAITYSILNQGTSVVSAAPWEVSRVAAKGLSFFPNPGTGQVSYPAGNFAALPNESQDGYTFIADAAAGTDQKLFADGGAKGYVAHLAGDRLFVKAWLDVPGAARAPGEGEIEIYAAAAGTYVELENQGSYASIAPGGRADWQVHWSVAKVAAPASARQSLEQAADGMASQ